jgi:hypothetical protein
MIVHLEVKLLIEYLLILFRFTCESGTKRGGGRCGSGCGSQVVPEKLPHSVRLLLAGSDHLVNTADVSKRKHNKKKSASKI